VAPGAPAQCEIVRLNANNLVDICSVPVGGAKANRSLSISTVYAELSKTQANLSMTQPTNLSTSSLTQ
jgi:hypothetical protein